MLIDGVVALLKANAGVSALTTTIRPSGSVKDIVDPFIIYQEHNVLDTLTAQGSTELRCSRFQLDCYSGSYTTAKRLAKAVRAVFKNLKNTTLTDTDATFVQGCLIDFESDMPDIPTGLKDISCRTLVQVSISYRES